VKAIPTARKIGLLGVGVKIEIVIENEIGIGIKDTV